ncbi:hypothetical protein V8F33_009485 [Rhypophila sp. PSN 637]
MASQSESRADSQEQHTNGETLRFQTNSQHQPETNQSSVDGQSTLRNRYATYETDSDPLQLASHDEERLHGNNDYDISSVSQPYYMSAEEENGPQESLYPSLEEIYPENLDLTKYEESHIGDENIDTPLSDKANQGREHYALPSAPLTGHINPGWECICGVDQDGHSFIWQYDSDSYYLRKTIEGGKDCRPGAKCKWQKVPRSKKEVRMPANIPRTKINDPETGKEQKSSLVPELMLTTPDGEERSLIDITAQV